MHGSQRLKRIIHTVQPKVSHELRASLHEVRTQIDPRNEFTQEKETHEKAT